jgi:hypothetical protein
MREDQRGDFKGQVRLNNNSLEQWDGWRWHAVPHVLRPENAPTVNDGRAVAFK